jgi:uncharacterized small protein (DUF1192 family)
MNDEPLNEKPDMTLSYLAKQDLYTLSAGDLEERIAAMKAEIARCEDALKNRGDTRSEAEKLFKF